MIEAVVGIIIHQREVLSSAHLRIVPSPTLGASLGASWGGLDADDPTHGRA